VAVHLLLLLREHPRRGCWSITGTFVAVAPERCQGFRPVTHKQRARQAGDRMELRPGRCYHPLKGLRCPFSRRKTLAPLKAIGSIRSPVRSARKRCRWPAQRGRELGAKRLELLYELVPKAGTIALILNPNNQEAEAQRKDVQAAANTLGRRLLILRSTTERELESSLAMLAGEQVGGLIVENDPFFDSQRERLVALVAHSAVPAIYHIREFLAAGGLISYGASLTDANRQVGTYAGRILKGEKPDDLPFMQPTRFELVMNLKTARALGITVSQSLLLRADEIIQ